MEVESIIAMFQSVFSATVYRSVLPSDHAVPAWYFPPPQVFNDRDALGMSMKTYDLSVKLFHSDIGQAFEQAELVSDDVRERRHLIPILDSEGMETGDMLRISKLEVRKEDSAPDVGTAIVHLVWNSRYAYERETYAKMGELHLTEGVKET